MQIIKSRYTGNCIKTSLHLINSPTATVAARCADSAMYQRVERHAALLQCQWYALGYSGKTIL